MTAALPALVVPGEPQLVSVIVPCRNEAAYIDAFCDSVLAQVLPSGWRMEVLVADGQSDDGTRERLQARARAEPVSGPATAGATLRWVDNPQRIVSTGLNACLDQARGAVIVRLDVHTRFAPDYVAECIAALARSGADNVGGPWVAQGQGAMGRAVAAAFQSRWVVGGARSRDTRYEGPVDTVYLGCWPRDTLARVGGFDETLVRNQDDEHNLRLRLAGGRIWQSPRIRSWYVPRDSLGHLFRQQFQYGYWRPFVMRKHGQPGSLRQLVPAVFVAALCVGAVLAIVWPAPLTVLLGVYVAYVIAAAVPAALSAVRDLGADMPPKRRVRLIASTIVRLLLVVPTYHLGYGLGSWRGLLDVACGRRISGAQAKVTR